MANVKALFALIEKQRKAEDLAKHISRTNEQIKHNKLIDSICDELESLPETIIKQIALESGNGRYAATIALALSKVDSHYAPVYTLYAGLGKEVGGYSIGMSGWVPGPWTPNEQYIATRWEDDAEVKYEKKNPLFQLWTVLKEKHIYLSVKVSSNDVSSRGNNATQFVHYIHVKW